MGYRNERAGWKHADPDRSIVFLGDFIDRGPDNAVVLDIVRELMDAGKAQAVMGNHELNAIHYHSADPETGNPIREHSPKNSRQHASFLTEFPLGSDKANDAIKWMATLPLWLDSGPFRAVHACWSDDAINRLSTVAPNGRFTLDQLTGRGNLQASAIEDIEILTKGPELTLPEGRTFRDKNGEPRKEVRLAWWRSGASSWRDATISVPDITDLPEHSLSAGGMTYLYPESAKPVFFGHYWLEGGPLFENNNTCCLDCSAGTDGPLVAYSFAGDGEALSKARVITHDGTEI